MDPEFGFKADDKLITRCIACLQLEHCRVEETILGINEISTGIYFIQEGNIEVWAKNQNDSILRFESGTYIGDSSYIFKIRN